MASSLTWALPGTWPPRTVTQPTQQMRPAEPGLSDLDERALVEACLGGQSAAFDVIVERHRRSVYLLCYRFVSNHEDASDLSQDVFLRAYRGLRSFRGQSSLATWLYRIGVNVCLNRVAVKKPIMEDLDARQHVDAGRESQVDIVLREERGLKVSVIIE